MNKIVIGHFLGYGVLNKCFNVNMYDALLIEFGKSEYLIGVTKVLLGLLELT